MATALYPGSFDPVHLGHVSVIEKAATMFDQVVIAVVGNPGKRSGLLSIAERVALLAQVTSALPNVRCGAHHGLTVEAVRATGADLIIRTGHKDEGDEWSMLGMNERIAGTPTCFVPPAPELTFLSSSLVRSLLARGRLTEAQGLVPSPVAAALTTS